MTDALATLDIVRQTRQSLLAVVESVPEAGRTRIPDRFNNHILWNLGHIVVTERMLVYGLSGLPLGVPDEWVAAFRKGTTPVDGEAAVPYDTLRDAALSLPDQTEMDLRAGRFETYREYRTTPGVVLASAEGAIRFNLYHDGLHLGVILALRKLVG